ncbi:MAG: hypothetical protein EXX96DRAFT_549468 [Benjaminiella poitrasii]|nr:MAG: hypothetical protein EXX96DRAFT_549468 [Benjaminiella poitrasii]
MDSALLIKNASGKQFSLLNDGSSSSVSNIESRRKYHCFEPGCNKSFTTSGHLARHNRIHTGEKNFHCLHPGCPSRFSRQDNMMQHYRTHLCQKMRRQHHKKNTNKDASATNKKPQLHCHTFYEREDQTSFQPLTTRPGRATTMPSLPYSEAMVPGLQQVMNRPKRALSTSSTTSSSSSFSYFSSPSITCQLYQQQNLNHPVTILPPPPSFMPYPHHIHTDNIDRNDSQHQYYEWVPNTQKSLANLLHLANIVSTFG